MLLAIAGLLIMSCNDAGKESAGNNMESKKDSASFDMGKAKSAIADVNAKFEEGLKNGDSVTLGSLYASDAMVMGAGSEPVKKENIVHAWSEAMKMGVKGVKITTDDLIGNADVLAETGRYEMLGDKGQTLDKGKYVVVWKNEGGTWKLYRDIWNTNMAPPK